MNILHSTLSSWRDRLAPISHTSTFRSTGQITPEEFVLAGDYLVFKFPTWSWADAATPAKRVPHLPEGKQFLVTRGVPCHRRLNDDFAGNAGREDVMVGGDDGGDAWLSTGGMTESREARIRDVRTMDDSGNVGEEEEEEEIPDMEDEADDDEAIIREPAGKDGVNQPTRTYNLYITYSPYYRTPRLYLSGYVTPSEPLPPHLMMEDIVGDYKDKTVTLEDFPFFEGGTQMASVHPCKHASVMKVLLDRADAALRIRRQRLAAKQKQTQKQRQESEGQDGSQGTGHVDRGLEGLVGDLDRTTLRAPTTAEQPGLGSGDDWEVLQSDVAADDDDTAIRVDQYLVVFLKFIASVTPGIEHDYTMGL